MEDSAELNAPRKARDLFEVVDQEERVCNPAAVLCDPHRSCATAINSCTRVSVIRSKIWRTN